jgi:hypothetical protein
MARVKGPLLSLTASGTLDDVLLFKTTGATTTVQRPTSHDKPRTLQQQSHSTRVQEMCTAWRGLDAPSKLSWRLCAASLGKNGFKLFWVEWFLQNSTPSSLPVTPC